MKDWRIHLIDKLFNTNYLGRSGFIMLALGAMGIAPSVSNFVFNYNEYTLSVSVDSLSYLWIFCVFLMFLGLVLIILSLNNNLAKLLEHIFSDKNIIIYHRSIDKGKAILDLPGTLKNKINIIKRLNHIPKNGNIKEVKSSLNKMIKLFSKINFKGNVYYLAKTHIPFMFQLGALNSHASIKFIENIRGVGLVDISNNNDDEFPEIKREVLQAYNSEEVTLLVEITRPIDISLIPNKMKNFNIIKHTLGDNIKIDTLNNIKQLDNYLECIKEDLYSFSKINMFYAGPPCLAFKLGQLFKSSSHSSYTVFNFNRPRGKGGYYNWSLDISDNQDEVNLQEYIKEYQND
jgi:hypothetical protein